MSSNSPFPERARKESIKRGFRIPRRGRIRFVLIVIFIGIGLWWYKTHPISSGKGNSNIPDKTKVKKQKAPKKTAKKLQKEIPKKTLLKVDPQKKEKKLKVKRPKKMSFEKVCDLLASSPPR